jgi:hypothetical protein
MFAEQNDSGRTLQNNLKVKAQGACTDYHTVCINEYEKNKHNKPRLPLCGAGKQTTHNNRRRTRLMASKIGPRSWEQKYIYLMQRLYPGGEISFRTVEVICNI